MGRNGVRGWLLVGVAGLLTIGLPGPVSAAEHDVVVSPHPADGTPQVLDGIVRTIVQAGNRIVVGGEFGSVREGRGDRIVKRRNLFAFDPATGAIDSSFVPDPDKVVRALAVAPGGGAVFAGGRFEEIGGKASSRLAKLDLGSGRPVGGFSAAVTGTSVDDLVVSGDRLFLAGGFAAVGGRPRLNLAAVDARSGDLDPGVDVPFAVARAGRLHVAKIAIGAGGNRLVAIGNFQRAGGEERQQIAVLDIGARPARLANWHTARFADQCEKRVETYMRDVDAAPLSSDGGGNWFVVVTTGGRSRPTLCDTATRWEFGATGRNLQPTWVDSSGGDSFTGVGVSGEAVYVGGHMRWLNNPFNRDTGVDARPGPGAVPREGIAALDPRNGLPLAWNPGRDPRGQGAFALVPARDGLWVGSDTDNIDGQHRPRLALLPLAGGKAVARPEPSGLPATLYSANGDGLVRRRFDGQTAGPPTRVGGGPDWSRFRGAFAVGDTLVNGTDDGRLVARRIEGETFGGPAELPLNGLAPKLFPVPQVTGMFFDRSRLYYTVAGDRRLLWRWFTPASGIVGTDVFVASGPGDGVDWASVRGLTAAGDAIFHVATDGRLRRTDFRGPDNAPRRPVRGTTKVIASGFAPGRALFLR